MYLTLTEHVFDMSLQVSAKSNLIKSTPLQVQYLPHNGNSVCWLTEIVYCKESRRVVKVSDPGLWV